MNSNKFFIVCPWCGNRWYQDEQEPKKCKVCRHYCWEGTHEEHMKFSDLEAWNNYKEQVDWDYRMHENPYD